MCRLPAQPAAFRRRRRLRPARSRFGRIRRDPRSVGPVRLNSTSELVNWSQARPPTAPPPLRRRPQNTAARSAPAGRARASRGRVGAAAALQSPQAREEREARRPSRQQDENRHPLVDGRLGGDAVGQVSGLNREHHRQGPRRRSPASPEAKPVAGQGEEAAAPTRGRARRRANT